MNKLTLGKTLNNIPDAIFGYNLEITRKCFFSGLAAELLINRKFFAVDNEKNCPKGWMLDGGQVITDRREQSLCSSNFVRIDQGGKLTAAAPVTGISGKSYISAIWANSADENGSVISVNVLGNTFEIELDNRPVMHGKDGHTFKFLAKNTEGFEITCLKGSAYIYEVSLLPEDNFFGMRPDVIDLLRELKPSHLRYPGGCCTDHFDFKESLKPVSERKPLEAAEKWFVFRDTFDQDPYDIGLNEFIELCRAVGSEPEYTIRVVNSEPSEAIELVEYCNGDNDTYWGAKREALGYGPFNIKRFYIGNEVYYFGYEYIKDGKLAAERCDAYADAVKSVQPDLYLIGGVCGDFTHDQWDLDFVSNSKTVYDEISFHCYCGTAIDDIKQDIESLAEMSKFNYGGVNKRLDWVKDVLYKDCFDKILINVDEWNLTWGMEGSTLMMFTDALVFHFYMKSFEKYHIIGSRFFHPVNEGMIRVTPDGSRLDCVGTLMQYMNMHRGGRFVESFVDDQDIDILVTGHENNNKVVSVVNRSGNEAALDLSDVFDQCKVIRLKSDPCSVFNDKVTVTEEVTCGAEVSISGYEVIFVVKA